MNRLIIALLLLMTVILLATCERNNMYDLALFGLAPKSAIYLYQIGTASGDTNGIKNANDNCYTNGLLYHSLVSASNVKAFRSFSGIEEIRFIVPARYWQYPVLGISATLTVTPIAASWVDMWHGVLDNPIDTALGITGSNWWSGSNADGSISADTCDGWHQSSNAFSGQVGGTGISDAILTCDNNVYSLCVAY